MKLFEQVCKANISTVTFFATADSEHVRITLGNIPAGISVREWLTLLSDRLSELDSDVLYKLDGFLNIYHYQLECSLEFNSGLC